MPRMTCIMGNSSLKREESLEKNLETILVTKCDIFDLKKLGINHIATFIDYKSTKLDDWHISELCGKPLSSLLFDVKGEFYKGERLYGVKKIIFSKSFNCFR